MHVTLPQGVRYTGTDGCLAAIGPKKAEYACTPALDAQLDQILAGATFG